MSLQWQTANPVYGPGISTTGGGVYRIHKSEKTPFYPQRWRLYVSDKLHGEYRTRREAKEAAELYEVEHPWDRTGHR